MTNIKAEIIADSINKYDNRLTTFQITLPKALLAELNTHRVLSKNAASSRAIPNGKFQQLPSWTPIRWGMNQSGMSAKEENLEGEALLEAQQIWEDAIYYCKRASTRLAELGLHKQWANRLNDWHIMVDDVITGTEWDNFFNLRIHPSAQPEMDYLARMMRFKMNTNIPVHLTRGRWHLPFVSEQEQLEYSIQDQLIMSTARCCRVSYNNHGGNRSTLEEDKRTYSMLGLDQDIEPKHASPCEHQATPDDNLREKHLYGNLKGWIQHRKVIEENSGKILI